MCLMFVVGGADIAREGTAVACRASVGSARRWVRVLSCSPAHELALTQSAASPFFCRAACHTA
jgi:hypothetical protein